MTPSSIPFATLLTELSDVDSKVRRQAISRIMRRGERAQAYSALLPLLGDADPQVCKAAIKALGTLDDPRAFAALAPLVDHHSLSLRILTLQTLSQLDYPRTVPYWVAAQRDRYYRLRMMATDALRDARAVEPLITLLSDTDSSVRERAVRAIGPLGDARAVEPLLALLSDTDNSVRTRVAYTLGQLGDRRAMEPLLTLLSDPSWNVRAGAAYSLGELGDRRAVEPLIRMLSDPTWLVRTRTITSLGQLGDERAIPPLRALLATPLTEEINDEGVILPVSPAGKVRQALARLEDARDEEDSH